MVIYPQRSNGRYIFKLSFNFVKGFIKKASIVFDMSLYQNDYL